MYCVCVCVLMDTTKDKKVCRLAFELLKALSAEKKPRVVKLEKVAVLVGAEKNGSNKSPTSTQTDNKHT